MALQNVFIIGATGNVGSELIRQILLHDSPKTGKHRNPTNIVGIANKAGYGFNTGGVCIQNISPETEILKNSKEFKDFLISEFNKDFTEYSNEKLEGLLKVIEREGLEGDVVFIDATDGKDDLTKFHQKVINDTNNNIVTANKNPLVDCTPKEFELLIRYRDRYGMRAAVMGGAHTVNQLIDFYDTSEHITCITGCFSGTLGYLCSELEKNKKPFSEIVKDAVNMKFTEPNPIDDLNGRDVARKLVIIARSLNYLVNLEDVKLEGFIDTKKYLDYSINDLLNKISEEDESISKKFREAKEKGQTLRYIASLEITDRPPKPPNLKVGLESISKDSILGSLKGSANKISIRTTIFSEGKEYIIQSPGAGIDVTATGIRRDLLRMLKGRKCGNYPL